MERLSMNLFRKIRYSALVGIVPRRNLWDLIQKEMWYHIPVKVLDIDVGLIQYLAFYFPKCFEEKYRFAVHYYAKVLKVNVVKRIELFPNEKNHKRAYEDYYKFYINEIKKLPFPIPSKRWRRILHIPTNKYKLFNSKDINELWHTSPIEEVMYNELRQRNIETERQLCVAEEGGKYYLDFGIYCKNGRIDIECDGEKYHTLPESLAKDRRRNNNLTSNGWQVLRFSGKEIKNNIDNCIKIVEKTIKTLGGLKE